MYASSEEQSRPQLVVLECGCVGVGSGECMLAFYTSGGGGRRSAVCSRALYVGADERTNASVPGRLVCLRRRRAVCVWNGLNGRTGRKG